MNYLIFLLFRPQSLKEKEVYYFVGSIERKGKHLEFTHIFANINFRIREYDTEIKSEKEKYERITFD